MELIMLKDVRPFPDFASFLKAVKGSRTMEDLATISGTSQSTISKAIGGGPLPEDATLKLAKSFHLEGRLKEDFLKLAASARAHSHKAVREYVRYLEAEVLNHEKLCLSLARTVIRLRKECPEELVTKAESVIALLDRS